MRRHLSRLEVLQAASRVLSRQRPEQRDVAILTDYAEVNLPERLGLAPDELATVVALKLMDIPGDPEQPVAR
jgi:hypothetical protein